MEKIIKPGDYYEIMYPKGSDTAFSEQRCPICGDVNCWDLDSNKHGGITDEIVYSCACGGSWVEFWKIEKVVIVEK